MNHKVKPAFRRQPLISGIPGSFPLILLAILLVAATLPLSHRPPPPRAETAPPPFPAPVEARIQAEGYDRRHRSLPFTVYVLSQQLSWKLESVTGLEGDQPLLNPELAAAINRAQDVFCVGTASFEGGTSAEEARAAQRARSLAQWVRAVIREPDRIRVFSLNAGQYKGPPELQSTHQRKAILIVTAGHAQDVDLGDALASGLAKKQREYPILFSLLHHYSRSGVWLRTPIGPGPQPMARSPSLNGRRSLTAFTVPAPPPSARLRGLRTRRK